MSSASATQSPVPTLPDDLFNQDGVKAAVEDEDVNKGLFISENLENQGVELWLLWGNIAFAIFHISLHQFQCTFTFFSLSLSLFLSLWKCIWRFPKMRVPEIIQNWTILLLKPSVLGIPISRNPHIYVHVHIHGVYASITYRYIYTVSTLWQTLGSYRSTGPSVTADVALLAAMSAQINLHPYAKYCIKFVSVADIICLVQNVQRGMWITPPCSALQCPAVPVPRKNPAPLMEGESAAVCCVCTA